MHFTWCVFWSSMYFSPTLCPLKKKTIPLWTKKLCDAYILWWLYIANCWRQWQCPSYCIPPLPHSLTISLSLVKPFKNGGATNPFICSYLFNFIFKYLDIDFTFATKEVLSIKNRRNFVMVSILLSFSIFFFFLRNFACYSTSHAMKIWAEICTLLVSFNSKTEFRSIPFYLLWSDMF